jgi:hypothetical protein
LFYSEAWSVVLQVLQVMKACVGRPVFGRWVGVFFRDFCPPLAAMVMEDPRPAGRGTVLVFGLEPTDFERLLLFSQVNRERKGGNGASRWLYRKTRWG